MVTNPKFLGEVMAVIGLIFLILTVLTSDDPSNSLFQLVLWRIDLVGTTLTITSGLVISITMTPTGIAIRLKTTRSK
ncbi:MAG: hypothetical protein ACFFD4_26370 [Candidatus Odinarchaeota archaeon]